MGMCRLFIIQSVFTLVAFGIPINPSRCTGSRFVLTLAWIRSYEYVPQNKIWFVPSSDTIFLRPLRVAPSFGESLSLVDYITNADKIQHVAILWVNTWRDLRYKKLNRFFSHMNSLQTLTWMLGSSQRPWLHVRRNVDGERKFDIELLDKEVWLADGRKTMCRCAEGNLTLDEMEEYMSGPRFEQEIQVRLRRESGEPWRGINCRVVTWIRGS